ncbi:cyclic beta 1-2 glucan synthetase [Clostridiaceae bacterium 14S0207]|nr:cyclic beta 1-2 glucan synthetase [Clostridiaceae bacterium 14S0207]
MTLIFYLETIILILALIILIVLISRYEEFKRQNIINDMYTINIKHKDSLEKHAENISTSLTEESGNVNRKNLIKNLNLNFQQIIKVHNFFDKEVNGKKDVLSSSEWLLDNLYLIEKDYKGIKTSMPRRYYGKLPIIKSGFMKGYPRVYYLAVQMVSHTEGDLNVHIIENFISSFERSSTLTMSELWAIPVMIRIALIQNIARISLRLQYIQKERNKGEEIADILINAFNDNRLESEMKNIYKLNVDFNPYFGERFLKILRDNGIDNLKLYKWIEKEVNKKGVSFENLILTAHQKQSNYAISLGNSINSIRKIEALDWKAHFENLSKVHQVLSKDPSGEYLNMDFKSRDYYRHKISALAKKLKTREVVIAEKAIECAEETKEIKNKKYLKHVGYYIFDKGKLALIQKVRGNLSITDKIVEFCKKQGVYLYLEGIIFTTVFLISSIINLSINNDYSFRLWKYIVAIILLIVPCSEIVISIINWSITHLAPVRFIAKLDFKKGIGKENRTVVIIPTLINSEKRINELLEKLEVYYLANQDENLYFAILSDFNDSKLKEEENDERIIEYALKAVKNLNKKYGFNKKEKFFFFSRERKLNESEGYYLGWERKRGKIMEFNQLLRGKVDTSYNVFSSSIEELKDAKYIITLDSDTELPRDSAKKIIGAMAHSLNKPHFDEEGRIFRGYGLLQPKVSISTVSANKTMFSKIFSGETGIDTYSTAVSDVYQDLFDEGIFTGKGIYDIDVFMNTLEGEIPENLVLSHDLLEGSYNRAGLITDVELIDGYPAYYNASAKRIHRWVRGDWQLLRWLKVKSPLNDLSKWKIFDNLRRSLVAPSIMILVLFGILGVLPDGMDKWLVLSILTLVIPILFDVTENVVLPMKGVSLSGKVKNEKMIFEQFFLIFTFLPHKAILMVDAICRTLYRVLFSKKHLLQWQTSDDVEKSVGRQLKDFIKFMWSGSILGLIVLAGAFLNSIDLGIIMITPCIIWFLSPLIAYRVSLPLKRKKLILNEEEINILKKLSRKTWAYFEDFVNEENNFLGPDNYQQDPPNGVAYRTSPTNIGMTLTSNVVALDQGYIGILQFMERTDKTLKSTEILDKFHGHLYNWYNTKTKEPLYPRFVSTVDSGNLVGYYWLCGKTLEDRIKEPLISSKIIQGLNTTIELAKQELVNGSKEKVSTIHLKDQTQLELLTFRKNLVYILKIMNEVFAIEKKELLYWSNKVRKDTQSYLNELDKAFPFIKLLEKEEIDENLKKELLYMVENASMKELPEKLFSIEEKIEKEYKNQTINLENLKVDIKNSRIFIASMIEMSTNLIKRMNDLAELTDFKILYSKERGLFSIGYDIENNKLNNSFYDLLASESRQGSFVAIAKGDVPKEHWFKLGRAMILMGKSRGLVSWSGTMFEYFMPLLIMKAYPNTILDKTYDSVIEGQKRYAKKRKVPFGISESAFYEFDMHHNYQYKAFGVPGVGLKRGLIDELVISPYSTVMALQKDLSGSIQNIIKLINMGIEGTYGFFESIDYTKTRIGKHKTKEIVKCFMIHHQGMSLMALDNVLNNNILQERFHKIPRVKATELLLQERVPKNIVYDREYKYDIKESKIKNQRIIVRKYTTAKTSIPEVQLLSNGKLSLMISNSGSGYAKLRDIFLYRWREDVTEDNTGLFIYIKDINSKDYWSATYAPTMEEGEDYEITFAIDKAKFHKVYKEIVCDTSITLSSQDDVEVRKIILTNLSEEKRELEVISYGEVVLSDFNADLVHPAFSNLFVTTEFVEDPLTLIAKRRTRVPGKQENYLFHTVVDNIDGKSNIEYETARINFIGRGRNKSNPISLEKEQFTNSTGVVLDPIISFKEKVTLEKGEKVVLAFITGIATSKENALKCSAKYRDMCNINKTFDVSFSQAQMELRYLGIKSPQANLFSEMASRIIYISPLMKQREESIKNIRKGQSALWSYGISGDLPIVVIKISKEEDIDKVRQILIAHEYWRMKGLKVDLVIINEEENSYLEPLQSSLMELIYSTAAITLLNKSGGVFILSKGRLGEGDVELLEALSKIFIYGDGEFIKNQIKIPYSYLTERTINKNKKCLNEIKDVLKKPYMEFYNGYGGFSKNGREYHIFLQNGENTPAPWINVISNKTFGFHISESGSSYTWNENSRENKITEWNNDWISDAPSEVLYIKDNEEKAIWSITPKPIRDKGDYLITHGFGYSKFLHEVCSVEGEEIMFVPMNEKIKLIKVRLKNKSHKKKKLVLCYYAHLVLGVVSAHTASRLVTFHHDSGFMYAKNPYSMSFSSKYAFINMSGVDKVSYTGWRTEFIGRGGTLQKPEGLEKENLSCIVGAGMDPCFAIKGEIELNADEEKEIIISFGEEDTLEKVEQLVEKYSVIENVNRELDNSKNYWKETLGKIKVKTPNKSMNLLLNGWLMYQTIVCRLWSRTAFYQSGGAYGFRDQLQDVMPVAYLEPSITRKQILYSASRQFLEGDVQHWWHPVVESGIRTRFSDDLLWLPYVTADYIKNTGDYSILKEEVSYLEDESLNEGEDERYDVSKVSKEKGTIYEHCLKALNRGLKFGAHNLPLMGSGDWNDGMSTVGNKGQGESIWLAWFLYSILNNFIPICEKMDDIENIKKYTELKEFIRENTNKSAWDGKWYRRAYFDNGVPLGSSKNSECKIDSLAQSWAVISNGGDKEKIDIAMKSLEKYLIKENEGLILLLTPAFYSSELEPGYIKGYVPGVRENGGQYTHASTWVILAMCKLNEYDKAFKLFSMISPINHTKTKEECDKYKVEPYVMSADVYGVYPHIGRGGWSWYTGTSAWMYRVAIEGILGLKLMGEKGFTIDPCVPREWKEYDIDYIKDNTEYHITVKNIGRKQSNKNISIFINGSKIKGEIIPYISDKKKIDILVEV